MSTHAIEIVEIKEIFPHPNPEAEKMEITKIWGWTCCIGKGQFKIGDKAVYVPPDFLVPLSNPAFKFLDKQNGKSQERIRVRRFKGTISQGVLINVPEEFADKPVGTNLINELGIERYEPELPKSTFGNFVSGPSGLYTPKFDVENFQRYTDIFENGEEVVVTEKYHGANSRWTYAQDKDGEWKQFVGSRTNWMADDAKNIWWMAFRQNPQIAEWCKANPNMILYGEVFGQVQGLKYGAKQNEIFFVAFGILDKDKWLDFDVAFESVKKHNVKWANVLYRGPINPEVEKFADGDSTWPNANHYREGCVIIPIKERVCESIGRVCLKIVSNTYLEKSK